MKRLLFLILPIISLYAGDKYISINKSLYRYFEYKILKTEKTDIFVLNQPYKQSTVKDFLDQENYNSLTGLKSSGEYQLSTRLAPGFGIFNSKDNQDIYPYFNGEIVSNIGNLLLVNNVRADFSVQYDPYFHGDASSNAMGYFDEAYGAYQTENIEFFGGRISRNWGTLNDYSLILSNNPYAYDHFGVSANYKKLKYSFYFTRLNDMLGTDYQQVVIPDTTAIVRRFWSIQRLDYKYSDDLQMGFSQATVYGGPDQQYMSSYLSPLNSFYVSQRNENHNKNNAQMSFYLDANFYYRPFAGTAFYLDLFMDDLTINNVKGQNDRAEYPDRLAVQFKTSTSDLLIDNSLNSLCYTRVWNDTYTTFRDFENYIYFEKSMGYPYNAYESYKYSFAYFGFNNISIGADLEYWRRGDRSVKSLYKGRIVGFPAPPVLEGLNMDLLSAFTFYGVKAELDSKTTFITKSINGIDDFSYQLKLNVVYDFCYDFVM